MVNRIREAFTPQPEIFKGPVEVDETYMGGRRRNMSKANRAKLEGWGAEGKAVVAGGKDRQTKRGAA